MLTTRLATSEDLSLCFNAGWLTLEQSFDPRRDTTLILHHSDQPSRILGMTCMRPMVYSHSFHLSLPRLPYAERLFADGRAWARRNGLHGTVFQIGSANEKMIRFMRLHHAVIEPDSLLCRFDLLPTSPDVPQ